MEKKKRRNEGTAEQDKELVLLMGFDSGPVPEELLVGAMTPLRWDDLNQTQQVMVAGTAIKSIEVAAAIMRGERPFPAWVDEMHREKEAEKARQYAEEQRLEEIDAADPVPNGALRRYFRELQTRRNLDVLNDIDIDNVFGQRTLNEEDANFLRSEMYSTVTRSPAARFPLGLLIVFARGDWKAYEAELDEFNRTIELIWKEAKKRKPSLTYGSYQDTFAQLPDVGSKTEPRQSK